MRLTLLVALGLAEILSGQTITALTPTAVTEGATAFALTVNGSGFVNHSVVNFGGVPLDTVEPARGTLTAAVTPALVSTPGNVNVTVRNPNGDTSAPAPFAILPAPVIDSISPSSALAGSPTFTLTVTGANFVSGDTVAWNGTALTTTLGSDTQLTAMVPPSQLSSAGTATVTVQTADGVSSAGAPFTVNVAQAPAPAPTISSLSPSSVTAGGAAFTLTVNGANFQTGADVVWNGLALPTTVVSATQLTAGVPATLIAAPGSVPVSVLNPDGSASAPAAFAITAAAPPTISSLSPASVTAGSPAFTLTVNGSNFVSGSAVVWNGTALTTTVVNSGQLTAAIGPSLVANTGTVQVSVQNPDGSASSAQTFLISASLSITTGSPLPNGIGGTAYSQGLQAGGGTPPYTWSISSGSPPSGISLSGNALSGTPSATGTFAFTVRLTDGGGGSVTKDFTITIVNPVGITTASLPNGSVGAPYSQTVAATAGVPPYTWSVSSGSLPAKLSLDASGAISGTPSTAGTSTFTIRVGDSAGGSATRDFTITIAPPLAVATTSLPTATRNTPYSQALAATGGNPPYTWSLAGGNLPAGISLTGGALSGTPTATGTSRITVKVADSLGASATSALTLIVTTPVAIGTSSLPNGTVSVAYSQTLAASGGTPPYSWAVTSGAFPDGLKLAAGGAISGTPTKAGNFSASITATDSAGATASHTFPLAIAPPLTISTPPALAATAGTSYSAAFTAAGGNPPYTWSVAAGSLPSGINLGAGVLSGTTTAVGIFDFTVQAADTGGAKATSAVQLVVNPPLAIVTTGLSTGIAGVAYSQPLTSAGGTAPLAWSIKSGNLPPGLALSGGAITGTPGATGSFTFTVGLADAIGAAVTHDFTITVGAGLTITTTVLPNATAGVPYSQAVSAAGGASPYTWAVTGGALPPGLSLDSGSGAISGTPTTPGPDTFTLQVTDTTGAKVSGPLKITVAPQLSITTATLPNGATSAAYSQALAAAGGTPPYIWSLASGQLPPGLQLNASGALGGTPTQNGDFGFTVQVADNSGATATKALTIHVGGGLTIATTSPLQSGKLGSAYVQTFTAVGGVSPYQWATAAGSSLPPGLSLDPASGVISGTPTTSGSFTIAVQVTDAAATVASGTFTLIINGSLAISTASLPAGAVSTPYSQTLAATGGTPPYTWALTAGALPAGVTLDAATGLIAGTPSAAGAFPLTVQVKDSAQVTATQAYTLNISVSSLPAVAITGIPDTGQPLSQSTVKIALATPFAAAITGQITLTFASTAVVPSDDKAIAFSNGQRTIAFSIAAGQTQAQFPDGTTQVLFQNGTVAGTITATVALQAAGVTLTPAPAPVQMKIAAAAPAISSVKLVTTATGFEVWTTGFSTTREITEADYTFDPSANSNLQTAQVTLPLGAPAQTWYQDPGSTQWGSQFTLVQPFTVQGTASAIGAVSVTLKNAQGGSQTMKATF